MSEQQRQQQEKLSRRKHHKVLSGCVTCKRRRVKCDEAQPTCQRCTRAKVPCGGYKVPKARIFEPTKSTTLNEQDLTRHGLSDEGSFTDPHQLALVSTAADPLAYPDHRPVHHHALFGAFLTTWLPDGLLQRYASPSDPDELVPMSSWAYSAWQLARRQSDSVVAQSVMCLTLVLLGTQLKDRNTLADASRQYDIVLKRLQQQIFMLASPKDLLGRDQRIAELTAASFVCSQIEYMLRAWYASDLHLQGMESLWVSCEPESLENADIQKLFYDYCLLWISCSVIHRKHSFAIPRMWHPDNPAAHQLANQPTLRRLAVAERLPALLEEFDFLSPTSPHNQQIDMLHRLLKTVTDIALLDLFRDSTEPIRQRSLPMLPAQTAITRPTLPSLPSRVLTCYAYAYALQAALPAWELVRRLQQSERSKALLSIDEEVISRNCEQFLAETCLAICQLTDNGFGLFTCSPCLFALDSAWTAYAALARYRDFNLDDIRPWFLDIGSRLASVGYHPLREPWRTT